ncbi:MAG: segregation/condensation protein A [Candidatus Eisenbacteria bacterium]|nr:segregation/condensation protein A [Candidatus Eisenbacteria bacterium]
MEPAAIPAEGEPGRYRGHPVRLDSFEGPLDLLLHLIKKDRIEIWQISVSRITRQYLEYIGTWQSMNIEVAGDFLVMAATLMRMKSQMLLPRPSFLTEADDDDLPLTREELIDRLIEYRRIREAAANLRALEARQAETFPRGSSLQLDPDYKLPLREPKLFDLVEYLRDVLKPKPVPLMHQVQLEEYQLDEQMDWVLSCLRVGDGMEPLPATLGAPEGTRGIRFDDLLRRRGALYEVVVTFLAVLELSKYQRLRSRQTEALSEIWLLAPDPDAPRVHPDGTPIDPEPELLRPVGEPVATA